MRHTIKGLVAALAVMTAGAAPAMACGFGGCSPCGAVSPCATSYAPAYTYEPAYTYAPSYSYSYGGGCGGCGTGWGYERLAEPTTQYYYVNQGPTYSGPGSFAPYPAYEENAVPSYGYGYGYQYGYRHHRPWYNSYRYGHAPHHYAYRHWGHEGYYWGHPLVRRYY
jgi:hypothetical protein